MEPGKVTDTNRMQIIYSLAKGDAARALSLEGLSNDELQNLLSSSDGDFSKVEKQYVKDSFWSKLIQFQEKYTLNNTSDNAVNIFSSEMQNRNFYLGEGVELEKSDNTIKTYSSPSTVKNKEMSDEELKKEWDKLPQYIKDLYETYLENLSEAERVEAEKGFLDKLRDFFSQSFKLSSLTDNPSMMIANGEAWENSVKDALTNDVQKKLKNDETNIKKLASLSKNFEENIGSIKETLKHILGVDISEEEIRANKDKLLQIAELSQDFDGNISEITQVFKEMTGLDVLEEDLLKNKENIDKLNTESEKLEEQYTQLKDKYKEITGKELSDEEFEKLLNGESEVDNEEFNQLLQDYVQGYEEFAETAADVISGVASFSAFCGATMVGGPMAGYAAAVATGAGVKYGLKKANASGKSEGYSTACQDLVSGGVGGLFNALAPTIGSAATRAVFNRGGKVLLEKVAMKSASKSLPAFLNKAVSMDNNFLGSSAVKKITARYMQAAVEGTVSITPYNIASELTADEANKQGWDNVAINSVLGGIILGPAMDLGFRAIGKGARKAFGERPVNIDAGNPIRTGSPVNAVAYKGISENADGSFTVKIKDQNVTVKLADSELPADPAYIYAQACKKIGITDREEILKTLGLRELPIPSSPEEMKAYLNSTTYNENFIITASDGKQNYNVKINPDNTVTITSLDGVDNNYSIQQKTMSIDEFVNSYQVSAFERQSISPELINSNYLDDLSESNNILVKRQVYDDYSEEISIQNIDRENRTVTVRIDRTEANGNHTGEFRTISYDEFIEKFKTPKYVNELLPLIHNVCVANGYDEEIVKRHMIKGLTTDSPIFKNAESIKAYLDDFQTLTYMKKNDGQDLFGFKYYDYGKNKIDTEIDAVAIKEILYVKHSRPKFASEIDKLISLAQQGKISIKEVRNITMAMDRGYVSSSTIDLAFKNNLVENGQIKFTSLIDNEKPSREILAQRKSILKIVEQTIGKEQFEKLKTSMGEEIYNVKWELIANGGLSKSDLQNFVRDIPNINMLKKLEINPENFFINIEGYGKDADWARSMVQTSDYAAFLIENGASAQEVLWAISKDTRQLDLGREDIDIWQAQGSGMLRYENKYMFEHGAYTRYGNGGRYDGYKDRFDKFLSGETKELHNPYDDIELTRIREIVDDKGNKITAMMHPKGKYGEAALKHVDTIYKNLREKYAGKKITAADMDDINGMVAEMHWLIAQTMPWGRGSDCIVNAFVKSVYKSLGVETFPPAKGVSFDLEAFCTELSDYKKKYASYYSQPPRPVE